MLRKMFLSCRALLCPQLLLAWRVPNRQLSMSVRQKDRLRYFRLQNCSFTALLTSLSHTASVYDAAMSNVGLNPSLPSAASIILCATIVCIFVLAQAHSNHTNYGF